MPLLALAIPYARANPVSLPVASNSAPHEVAIDMEEIKNRLPRNGHEQASATQPSAAERFHRVYECRLIPINEYFDNTLAELVTPQSTCAPRTYACNAELRAELAEILRFHPLGKSQTVEAQIVNARLPSLLVDDPAYLPGTLSALRYDVGAHSLEIGRITFPDMKTVGVDEYLFAGESELAFLHEGNPHASRIRQDHAAILDFHYRAAGMPGHTSLPSLGYVDAAHDETHLSDFVAQLNRCQHRGDHGHDRAKRATPRRIYPIHHALDSMQNGLICSLM